MLSYTSGKRLHTVTYIMAPAAKPKNNGKSEEKIPEENNAINAKTGSEIPDNTP